LRQNFIALLAYIYEPYSSRSNCSSLFWTSIRDVPAGGMWHGRSGHDPYYGREARATSAAVDAYGISRGDACIYSDYWSVSRKRGERRSLPSSAVLPS
jgi:hypothetical protein